MALPLTDSATLLSVIDDEGHRSDPSLGVASAPIRHARR
jgi:hypothetical protein